MAAMACARCPYKMNYELLWAHTEDPEVVCVMLRCCAGPELQVRRGSELLLDEVFPTATHVRARAQQLLDDGFDAAAAEARPL